MRETGAADGALYCRFVLSDQHFAVPTLCVREVLPMPRLTPIPGSPAGVSGYVNLRGQLHLVLDISSLLSVQPDMGQRGSLIVFQQEVGEAFAVRIDQLHDMVTIDKSQIDTPSPTRAGSPGSRSLADRLVGGHARLGDTLVTLLDPAELYELCLAPDV